MRPPAPLDGGIVTIRDIAAQAGVSPSTVSRVLNKAAPVAASKRAAVLSAVEALGYRPNVLAQELARGYSRAFGVLPQGISNPCQRRAAERATRPPPRHPRPRRAPASERSRGQKSNWSTLSRVKVNGVPRSTLSPRTSIRPRRPAARAVAPAPSPPVARACAARIVR